MRVKNFCHSGFIFFTNNMSYEEKDLCLHLLKRWKLNRTLQDNAVNLFSEKFSK